MEGAAGLIITVALAFIGSLAWQLKYTEAMVQKTFKPLQRDVSRILEKLEGITLHLQELDIIVRGDDGNNGLRSRVRKLEERFGK